MRLSKTSLKGLPSAASAATKTRVAIAAITHCEERRYANAAEIFVKFLTMFEVSNTGR